MQINFSTRKEYSGQNQTTLTGQYRENEWGTFLQWQTAGFQVKKGQKGTRIRKIVTIDKDQTALGQATKVPRFYTVFNREQVQPVMQMVNTHALGLAVAR